MNYESWKREDYIYRRLFHNPETIINYIISDKKEIENISKD